MKWLRTTTLVLFNAFMLNACASTTMPTLSEQDLPVITLPATHVQIVQTSARQDGNTVIVVGKVQRKKAHHRVIPKGHVDVAIVDENGKTIQLIATRYAPEMLPRLDGMNSSFLARIPIMAPEGSFISVKFHSGSHDS